jgi:hypothetical protein
MGTGIRREWGKKNQFRPVATEIKYKTEVNYEISQRKANYRIQDRMLPKVYDKINYLNINLSCRTNGSPHCLS